MSVPVHREKQTDLNLTTREFRFLLGGVTGLTILLDSLSGCRMKSNQKVVVGCLSGEEGGGLAGRGGISRHAATAEFKGC